MPEAQDETASAQKTIAIGIWQKFANRTNCPALAICAPLNNIRSPDEYWFAPRLNYDGNMVNKR
jgi:hypothetical protein